MSFVKKQNISIVVDEKDGKKYYKTIGEIVTMNGNDGEYQFIKLWGAGGVVNAKVFDQDQQNSNQQQAPAPQQAYAQQTGQQGYQQPQQQAPQQPQQGQTFNPGNGGYSQ
jgi:hypothetical protein